MNAVVPAFATGSGQTLASMADTAHPWFDNVDENVLRRRAGAKWRKYGPDVLAAWVADMDFPPFPPLAAALADQISTGDLGYPHLYVEPNPVIEAFCRWAERRYDWRVEPARVQLSVDVLQPIAVMIDRLTAPGDGVVVQTPIYPPFLKTIETAGRRVVDNPLGSAGDGYPLDVDGLRACIDERTKMLLVCNPHNPTGRVFSRAELEAIAEVAVEFDLTIVSDEIWADFIYPGRTHLPFATLGGDVAERTVTLTAATKTFSFAGLRMAVAHFGSARLHEAYQSMGRFLLGGQPGPGAVASICVWTEGDRWVDELVPYLDRNRKRVDEFVAANLAGVTTVAPEATYLAWLDCRELVRSGRCENPAQFFLERAKVALNDGTEFGPHGEGFARLNFATSAAMLDRVLDRLATALAS